MNHWLLLPVAAAALLLLYILAARKKRRDRKLRDDQRRLELILQPRETVKQICPQRGGRCILTSQRVIFDTHSGIHAVTLRSIKQCQGYTAAGKRTASIPQMAKLTIRAKQDYTIENTGEAFAELVKPLSARVKKQNDRKKEKKTTEKTE